MSNTTASAVSHYLDIYLLPDPEFATPNLMNALYAKLHRALHDRIQAQKESIGISFPDQRNTTAPLGTTLRLHSSEAALTALMSSTWLTGMRDHTRCTPIQAIPSGIQTHRSVRRIDVQRTPKNCAAAGSSATPTNQKPLPAQPTPTPQHNAAGTPLSNSAAAATATNTNYSLNKPLPTHMQAIFHPLA